MILRRLRDETSERHASLERRLPLIDARLSRDAYREIVARFYGYYRPLEEDLVKMPFWNEIDLNFADRLKGSLLKNDLLSLGCDEQAVERLPSCQTLPLLDTVNRVLGCLYVLEGATLGGQMITKHLHANLALTPEKGSAFFAGYGADTGARWQEFRAMMTARTPSPFEGNEIVASANRTFETLENWLFPS